MIAQSCKDNPTQFWRYVRTTTAIYNTMGNIKQTKANGKSINISDDTEKCKAFSDYFSGVYTQEPLGDFNKLEQIMPVDFMPMFTFTEYDYLQKTDKSNNWKITWT